MNTKKFTLFFLTFFILSYFLLFLLYYLVNPEQTFSKSITKKKFFYTKEYSKKQFEKLKNDNYTLIFGTSQIHRISTTMMNENILNFHNLYGEPGDILNFLQQLDSNQIKHINKIIYCIDLSASPGRKEGELIDYYEKNIYYPILTIEKLSRVFEDLFYNSRPPSGYLNEDGSIENLNPKEHHTIPSYPYEIVYPYDKNLIDGILQINQFALQHHKQIIFCTPVVSETYFQKINFSKLSPFFTLLLEGGIENIKLFYYIPGMTDLKNDKNEYLAFMNPQHLNAYFVKQWLKHYILTDNEYVISTQKELDTYIQKMELLQNK